MRYIGNKTRLLPFILGAIRRLQLAPGTAHDAFAGTVAVGRALSQAGWRVACSDLMTYSFVFQRAYIVARGPQKLAALRAADADVGRMLRGARLRAPELSPGEAVLRALGQYLATALPPETGFVTTHFSPRGDRMYFSEANAQRIDAARAALDRWWRGGLVSDDTYYILLAALIEGADRVANTAGVYAAYIKSWQPNALRTLAIAPAQPARGTRGGVAFRDDAAAVALGLGRIDLLYIDPPYNNRQYAGYYHVPEVIARGWFDDEPLVLRGKTGLLNDPALRSDWCSPRGAATALRALLQATGARHVLVSYNSEGVLPGRDLRGILAEAAIDGRVRQFTRRYRRYRADSDHAGRRYARSTVRELLCYARLR